MNKTLQLHRGTFSIEVTAPAGAGEYEIVAITAGTGNGWKFTPAVLQSSAPLWEGVFCFVDHALGSRSIRDIAGVLQGARYDEGLKGIRATLKPFGPAAYMLQTLAEQLVSQPEGKDAAESGGEASKIGFSADLSFMGSNHKVDEILKVFSVDLVVNPARGGKFLNPRDASNIAEKNQSTHLRAAAASSCPASAEGKGLRPEAAASSCPASAEGKGLRPEAAASSCPSIISTFHTQLRKGVKMSENQPVPSDPFDLSTEEALQEPSLAPESEVPKSSDALTQKLQQQLDQTIELRRQLSSYTLDQMLANSHLPKSASAYLRRQFSGKDFTLQELQAAIADQQQALSEVTASDSIQTHPRIDAMFNEADRLQAAVDDLFGVPRATGLAGATVPKLSGIRELYLSLTGDLELHGGYYAERVQLATTADFTGLVKNALNKLVANTWDELGRAGYDWWKYISVQEHFSTLHPITGTLVGTVGALPAVAEGGTYTELAVGDSPETANFIKYGGYIPLTLELIDRDETRKLRAYTRELASAGMRNISSLVSAIFTSNAGIGPTMADGGALFNATAVTTAGGHANLSTTALSSTSWDAVSANVYKQPMLIKNAAGLYGTGPQLAVNPKFLLVPRGLQKTAREICEGNFVRESGYVYDNVLKGSAVPVTVPDWTDTNNWAAACDPLIAPAVFIGERFGLMPEIFVAGSEHAPAVFTNDEHRLKVRHFLAVWVNDYRPLYKCNVA